MIGSIVRFVVHRMYDGARMEDRDCNERVELFGDQCKQFPSRQDELRREVCIKV